MDFAELLASLQNPGEDGISPTIYDDLSASYTDATSTRDAKIQVTGDELAAMRAELLLVKAMNYDLLIASGEGGTDNSSDTEEPDNSDSEDSDDSIGDDEDFFEEKD